jgi:hypothetical protein
MPQGAAKTLSILGFILFICGIVSILYYISPMRLIVDSVEPRQLSPLPAMFGGLSLLCGFALMGAARRRRN